MNAIILCGGKSDRTGFDKAFIRIGGKTLAERRIDSLCRRFRRIILVTDSPGKYAVLSRRGSASVEVVVDIVPGLGPLGGLATGLTSSDSRYNFVIACDLPFVSPGLMDYMAGGIEKDFQAVIPCYGNKYQPLCALYSRDCLDRIYEALARKRLNLLRVLSRLKVRKVRKKELLRFGDPDLYFQNINMPRELPVTESSAYAHAGFR